MAVSYIFYVMNTTDFFCWRLLFRNLKDNRSLSTHPRFYFCGLFFLYNRVWTACLSVCLSVRKNENIGNFLINCKFVYSFKNLPLRRPPPPPSNKNNYLTLNKGQGRGGFPKSGGICGGCLLGGSDERHYLLCASAKCSLAFKLLLLKKRTTINPMKLTCKFQIIVTKFNRIFSACLSVSNFGAYKISFLWTWKKDLFFKICTELSRA